VHPDLDNILAILDRPIAYHRVFACLTGSVTAALLLSQAVYWQRRATGWWWKTQKEWEEETGLSRREQESARRVLRGLGVLFEERRGIPARSYYRLDIGRLLSVLCEKTKDNRQIVQKRQSSMAELDQQVGRIPSRKSGRIGPTNTETTQETTTTTTSAVRRGSQEAIDTLTSEQERYCQLAAARAEEEGSLRTDRARYLAGLRRRAAAGTLDMSNHDDLCAWEARRDAAQQRRAEEQVRQTAVPPAAERTPEATAQARAALAAIRASL
jgi:hypothetical protein